MTSYALTQDLNTGIMTCKLLGPLSDADGARLYAEFELLIAEARRRSAPLRVFWDNREGEFFTSPALQQLIARFKATHRPGDRAAILVSSSLDKVRVKPEMNDEHQVFISESAAKTWLEAWSVSDAVMKPWASDASAPQAPGGSAHAQ